MSAEVLNIGLIGAGAIGWPQARPLGEKVTTHADAVFLEPDCHLTAVVEPDIGKAIWNIWTPFNITTINIIYLPIS